MLAQSSRDCSSTPSSFAQLLLSHCAADMTIWQAGRPFLELASLNQVR